MLLPLSLRCWLAAAAPVAGLLSRDASSASVHVQQLGLS